MEQVAAIIYDIIKPVLKYISLIDNESKKTTSTKVFSLTLVEYNTNMLGLLPKFQWAS